MTASSDIAVAMRGITKRFPGVLALDDVTLEVHVGVSARVSRLRQAPKPARQ